MRTVLLLLGAAAIWGCASTPETPEYLSANASCGVVVKGLGPSQAEPGRAEAVRFWYAANNQIVDDLFSVLEREYRVHLIEVPYGEGPRTPTYAGNALAQYKCNRLIQLSHNVNQDSSGPYFEFTVSIMRPVNLRAGDSGYYLGTTKDEFRQTYRFVRTVEVLKTFRSRDFAGRVYADMEKAGVLVPLHR